MDKEKIVRVLRNEMDHLKRVYHVQQISLFGSFIRGEETKKSDIDLLIEFTVVPSMFTYMELEEYLSQKLGRKVDLVTKPALKPYIGAEILREAVVV